jgi:Fe-S-cluster containining protein
MPDEFKMIAGAEFEVAFADLKRSSAQEAVIRFYARHDVKLEAAAGAASTKPACGSGCWYCCYYKVVAKPVEVFAIVDFVRRKYSPTELERALGEAHSNVAQVQEMTHAQHLATNQKCPFLVEDKCSIYTVRPSKCRNFHATDMERCRESFERPTDLAIPNSYVPEIQTTGSASSEGFEYAVALQGLDSRPYDLNAAFLEAIENPKCIKRFRAGKKAFLNAKFEDISGVLPSNT